MTYHLRLEKRMTKYRVFGVQEKNYYAIVEAEDEYEAWDIINGDKVFQWFEIPSDKTIEPTEVYGEYDEA
jgi:hypothetical protein